MGSFLNTLWLKLTLEPAMALEVVKQLLNVLIVFNFIKWDAQQLAVVNIFTGLLLQFIVRQVVTPNPKVNTVKSEATIKAEAQAK